MRIRELEARIFRYYWQHKGYTAPYNREIEQWWLELDILYNAEQ